MTPSFSRGSKGKHYRYYVSASLQQGGKPSPDITQRLPASEIEGLVSEVAKRFVKKINNPIAQLQAVHLHSDRILIDLPTQAISQPISDLRSGEEILVESKETTRLAVSISLPRRGGRCTIVASSNRKPGPDAPLIAALRKAHTMVRTERGMPVIDLSPTSPYDRKIQRLAFLAPDIQRDIMKGLHPPTLNLKKLLQISIPLDWNAQKTALGWHGN